ncbi:MAG: HAD family phosphatase [Bacteroidetes bacterium]|nr:HAD family phosphatase [Bacteroidota bacterium]
MLHPKPHIADPTSLKNIIFDFGGVICDLHIHKTEEKFRAFGPPKEKNPGTAEKGALDFEFLVEQLEKGKIAPEMFHSTIRDFYQTPPSDTAIDEAWNALLGRIPAGRIRLLEELRTTYRIFLLSNSNSIHYDCYRHDFEQDFGYRDFDELFEKAWFSFRIGLKKPDPAIFRFVLKEKNLIPAETLFIDDTSEHVEAARLIGIQGYHLKKGEAITALFH